MPVEFLPLTETQKQPCCKIHKSCNCCCYCKDKCTNVSTTLLVQEVMFCCKHAIRSRSRQRLHSGVFLPCTCKQQPDFVANLWHCSKKTGYDGEAALIISWREKVTQIGTASGIRYETAFFAVRNHRDTPIVNSVQLEFSDYKSPRIWQSRDFGFWVLLIMDMSRCVSEHQLWF